jgi:hypothetical protein
MTGRGQQKGGQEVKENQAGDQRRRGAQEEEREDGAVSAFLSLAAITHGRAAQSTCVFLLQGVVPRTDHSSTGGREKRSGWNSHLQFGASK